MSGWFALSFGLFSLSIRLRCKVVGRGRLPQRLPRVVSSSESFFLGLATRVAAVELPRHYFDLMHAELARLDKTKANPGAMFAAAVLYSKKHPANPSFGDRSKLELALALGDLVVDGAERDKAENLQDYEWEIHFWLDTYRLLENELGEQRRDRWKRELTRITRWFAGQVNERIDFPRYQGPFIRTSTNHLAIFASTVYLAGRVLPNKEWESLGARALHRLAAEEQTVDGYWGELTDNGPATGYNYLTMTCVALYCEHSQGQGRPWSAQAGDRFPASISPGPTARRSRRSTAEIDTGPSVRGATSASPTGPTAAAMRSSSRSSSTPPVRKASARRRSVESPRAHSTITKARPSARRRSRRRSAIG